MRLSDCLFATKTQNCNFHSKLSTLRKPRRCLDNTVLWLPVYHLTVEHYFMSISSFTASWCWLKFYSGNATWHRSEKPSYQTCVSFNFLNLCSDVNCANQILHWLDGNKLLTQAFNPFMLSVPSSVNSVRSQCADSLLASTHETIASSPLL